MANNEGFAPDFQRDALVKHANQFQAILDRYKNLPESPTDFYDQSFDKRLKTTFEIFDLNVFDDFEFKGVYEGLWIKVSPGRGIGVEKPNSNDNHLRLDVNVLLQMAGHETQIDDMRLYFEFRSEKDDEGVEKVVARSIKTGLPVPEGSAEAELLDMYAYFMLEGPIEQQREQSKQIVTLLGSILLNDK